MYGFKLNEGDVLVDRYRITKHLGEGGFGVVYAAEQLTTGQIVAVKVLRPERLTSEEAQAESIARFKREIKTMGALHHPNTVRMLDSGVTGEGGLHRFVVLEFIEGRELGDAIEEVGPMSPRIAVRIVSEVLDAISEAHTKGIVHRDLKPANIMLLGPMHRPAVKVLDFGIAAIQEGYRSADYQQITQMGQTRGTPSYMPPEQLMENKVGPFTDVYAMGLILAECLTGQQVVTGESVPDICLRQMKGDYEIPAAVLQSPFGPIVQKATAREADDRYASADEMLTALERVTHGGIAEAPLVQGSPRLPAAGHHTLPLMEGDELPGGETTQMETPHGNIPAEPLVPHTIPADESRLQLRLGGDGSLQHESVHRETTLPLATANQPAGLTWLWAMAISVVILVAVLLLIAIL